MDCCGRGYDAVFTERQAHGLRRRYERVGLTQPTRAIRDLLTEAGVEGTTVLEIGGGIGELQVELLESGAAHSTNVELSRSYEHDAALLVEEHGLGGRVARTVGDLVQDPRCAGEADIVVLNRVVCCYPDYEGLLRAAAERARHTLIFSYPPRNAVTCAALSVANWWLGLRRQEYRAFAHPPEAMMAVVGDTGLRPVAHLQKGLWHIAALERSHAMEGAA